MFNKSVSRIMAVQCVYCYSVGGQIMRIEDCKDYFYCDYYSAKPNISFGNMLIDGFFNACADLDLKIKSCLIDWKIERVDKVALSILRVGIAEFMLKPNTPSAVLIAEYLKISDMFLDNKSANFIHATMNKIFVESNQDLVAA